MTTEQTRVALRASVSAPDKLVLVALASEAGDHARLDIERLAFLTGYDQAIVQAAITRLLSAGWIYRVENHGTPGEQHQEVQFAGLLPGPGASARPDLSTFAEGRNSCAWR